MSEYVRLLLPFSNRLGSGYRDYLFDGIPLETALLNAQQDTEMYIACMSVIPGDANALRYDGMVKDCRRAYVPEIMWMYGG